MPGLLYPNTIPSTEVVKMATTFESAESAVDGAVLKTSTTTFRTSKKHGRYVDYDDRGDTLKLLNMLLVKARQRPLSAS